MQQLVGDVLGVVLSFLHPLDVLGYRLYTVNKEWSHVLHHLPHAWGPKLDLTSLRHPPESKFAWWGFRKLVITGRHCTPGVMRSFSAITTLELVLPVFYDSSWLSSMSKLQELILREFSEITDKDLAHIAGLPLRHLDLTECHRITDSGLAHFSRLPLQHLSLNGCSDITDSGLEHLSMLSLNYLGLEDTLVTGEGLKHLALMPLKHLDLSNLSIVGHGLAHISSLPIERLQLWLCRDLEDAGLLHICKLPLQHLELRHCLSITSRGLEILSGMFTPTLILNGITVSDTDMEKLCQHPRRHLEFTDCDITDMGLVHIRNMPLEHLVLMSCFKISDVGLVSLSSILSLKFLELSYCPKITDAGLSTLSVLPLETLELINCKEITDGGLVHLSALNRLDVRFCERITPAGIFKLYSLGKKSLEILY